MKKVTKEKILPAIILKYYFSPKKGDKKEKSGINCAWCLEKNIVNIGGGFSDDKGNQYQICEDCAVFRYKEEHRFHLLVAARTRRRRIFDVGYLFNEMVIDKYIKVKGIKDLSGIKTGLEDDVFIEANNLFNYLFSKEEKVKIEEIENQKDIEEIFKKRLEIIDFEEYFKKLGFI